MISWSSHGEGYVCFAHSFTIICAISCNRNNMPTFFQSLGQKVFILFGSPKNNFEGIFDNFEVI